MKISFKYWLFREFLHATKYREGSGPRAKEAASTAVLLAMVGKTFRFESTVGQMIFFLIRSKRSLFFQYVLQTPYERYEVSSYFLNSPKIGFLRK
jgi:hypothetical protein